MFTYFSVKSNLDRLQDAYVTLENDENFMGRKNRSIWTAIIIWVITIPICWFTVPAYFDYHHVMVIVGSIIQLVCTLFCIKEHIGVMHDAVAEDSYYWTKTAILLSVECCMTLGIFMGILHSFQVIYVITMLLIIWIPRLLFKPW